MREFKTWPQLQSVGILLLLAVVSLPPNVVEATEQFRIEAVVQERPNQDFVLHMKLTNVGHSPVTVSPWSLPWGNRWSTYVMAAKLVGVLGETLKEHGGIDDPPPQERIRIEPGGSLEGDIPLGERFPELNRALDTRDVVLLWVYDAGTSQDPSARERYVGWLMIPRRAR